MLCFAWFATIHVPHRFWHAFEPMYVNLTVCPAVFTSLGSTIFYLPTAVPMCSECLTLRRVCPIKTQSYAHESWRLTRCPDSKTTRA